MPIANFWASTPNHLPRCASWRHFAPMLSRLYPSRREIASSDMSLSCATSPTMSIPTVSSTVESTTWTGCAAATHISSSSTAPRTGYALFGTYPAWSIIFVCIWITRLYGLYISFYVHKADIITRKKKTQCPCPLTCEHFDYDVQISNFELMLNMPVVDPF